MSDFILIETDKFNEILEKALAYDILTEWNSFMYEVDWFLVNKEIEKRKALFMSDYVNANDANIDLPKDNLQK
jgi:hypothetical protein